MNDFEKEMLLAYLREMTERGDETAKKLLRVLEEGDNNNNKKFEVSATMDVGYKLIVEAPDEDTAWKIAKETDDISQWVKTDDCQDWTLENVYEVTDE